MNQEEKKFSFDTTHQCVFVESTFSLFELRYSFGFYLPSECHRFYTKNKSVFMNHDYIHG